MVKNVYKGPRGFTMILRGWNGEKRWLRAFLLIVLLFSLTGCIGKNNIEITLKNPKKPTAESLNITVSNVQVINHQIVITGTNLSSVNDFRIKEGSTTTNLQIESQTQTSLIANTISNVTFATGKVFDFIFSNAIGASTFTVDFSLCHSNLGGKAFDCLTAPLDKQVLSYDQASGKWKPRDVNGLNYIGTFDASSGANPAIKPAGQYYIVSIAGDIYTGATILGVGDWIVSNGVVWQKIDNTTVITSVFNRTGAVVATKGDYSLTQLSDATITGPLSNQVLKYNGTNWVNSDLSALGGGTVTSVSGNAPISVATGTSTPAISISKADTATNGYLSSADWTTFSGKQNAIIAGTTAQYYRGDKSWQELDTSVVPENGKLYFTNALALGVPLNGFFATNATITASDSILQAFGKAQGQINNLTSGGSNYLVKNGTDSITGVVNVGTIGSLAITYTPTNLTDATSKSYVDAQRDTRVAKIGDSMSGDLSLDTKLRLKDSTSNYVELKAPAAVTAYTLTLPGAKATVAGQVLTSDTSGVLSWTTVATGSTNLVGDIGGSISGNTIGDGKVTLTHLSATGTKDTTTYLRGDNTFASFMADVRAATLTGLSTATNAVIDTGDTVLSSLGKLQKQISDFAISAMGGDLSGNLPNPKVVKIQGQAVTSTAPLSGQVLKYNTGTPAWEPSYVVVGDLKSSALGNLFPGSGCSANQTLYYSAVGDAFSCVDVGSLDGSKITTGTIAAARLPASATYWDSTTGGINYAGGNVGIGTTAPTSPLHLYQPAGSLPNLLTLQQPISTINNVGSTIMLARGATTNYGGAIWNSYDLQADYMSFGVGWGYNPTLYPTMTIHAATSAGTGDVGIGTTSPGAKLHIVDDIDGGFISGYSSSIMIENPDSNGTGGSSALRLMRAGSTRWALVNDVNGNATDNLTVWGYGGVNAITVAKTSGNVGIGTKSPDVKLHVESDGSTSYARLRTYGDQYTGIIFDTARGSAASPADAQIGDVVGGIMNNAYFNGDWRNAGRINFVVSGTAGVVPNSDIVFSPSNGTIGNAERFRITSAGNVGIGTTSPASILNIKSTGNSANQFVITNSANANSLFSVYQNGSGDVLGYFYDHNGTLNAQIAGAPTINHTFFAANGGNVGIGTTGPATSLNIVKANSAGLGAELRLDNGTNDFGNSTKISFYDSSAAADIKATKESGYGGASSLAFSTNAWNGSTTAYAERMRISAGGNVGIGTTTPSEKLNVVGNILATGTITGSSDRRLKKNIRPIDDALTKLDSLKGVKYYWIDPEKHDKGEQIGLIAQDVEKVFPQAVRTDSEGFKSVSYMALVAPVVNAVKELYKKLLGLEAVNLQQTRQIASIESNKADKVKIKELEMKNQELEKRLAKIEKMLKE